MELLVCLPYFYIRRGKIIIRKSATGWGIKIRNWEIFGKYVEEYDSWYEKYKPAYESEILALKIFLPENLEKIKTLEVGAGTGRFAFPLGIELGLEPAKAMAELAKKRRIEMILGVAESLPLKNQSFNLVLIVTALAFFNDRLLGLKETLRVLKPGGQLLIRIIDRDSFQNFNPGSKRRDSRFSSQANFLSSKEVLAYLKELGFENIEVCQTIFNPPEQIKKIETPESGYGKGIFVIFSARKPYESKT